VTALATVYLYRLRDSFSRFRAEVETDGPLYVGDVVWTDVDDREWLVTNICPPSHGGVKVVNVQDLARRRPGS
jgi:hypothetical protein